MLTHYNHTQRRFKTASLINMNVKLLPHIQTNMKCVAYMKLNTISIPSSNYDEKIKSEKYGSL